MINLVLALVLVAGCSATGANYETRPFFNLSKGLSFTAVRHGSTIWSKSILVEFSVKLAADYAENPPERIAVLPFIDQSTAQFRVNSIAVTRRNEQQKEQWAWTYANRLRRSFAGQMAEREFTIVPMPAIDMILHDHGIDNRKKLMALPPQELGQWLDADTVVYGEVLHYDAYYALLVAAWNVGVKVQLASTRDGHQILEASDDRYSVDFRPRVRSARYWSQFRTIVA
jgi:hypothetical protein